MRILGEMFAIIVVAAILAAIWLLSTEIAQRLYPTFTTDTHDRRFTFRVVARAIQYAVLLAIAGVVFLTISLGGF